VMAIKIIFWATAPEQAYSPIIAPPRRLRAQRVNPQTPTFSTSPPPLSPRQLPTATVSYLSFNDTND
jgi:hypothetical protein